MIEKQRLKNYIFYAIGEIILVVIGILIALKVNNYNLQEQKNKQISLTSERVLNILKKDTTEIHNVLKIWNSEELKIDTILGFTDKNEPIKNCSSCKEVLYGFVLPQLSKNVITIIETEYLDNGKLGTVLKNIASDYEEMNRNAIIYESSSTELLKENLAYLRDNFPWFADFIYKGKCNDDCLAYHNNSIDFRNRVAYLNLVLYDSYYYDLFLFKNKINSHITELQKLLKKA